MMITGSSRQTTFSDHNKVAIQGRINENMKILQRISENVNDEVDTKSNEVAMKQAIDLIQVGFSNSSMGERLKLFRIISRIVLQKRVKLNSPGSI